jgi:hypothetical protein
MFGLVKLGPQEPLAQQRDGGVAEERGASAAWRVIRKWKASPGHSFAGKPADEGALKRRRKNEA